MAIAGAVALIAAAPAGAAWTPHVDVAVANYVSAPKVAMDPAGDAVFMWERSGGELYTRTRAADGTLSPIQAIGSVGMTGGVYHDLAVDPQGNAYFVWRVYDGSGFHIRARVLYADGTLGPTQTLKTAAGGDYAGDPMVAVDASGRAVFAWGFSPANGPDLIQTRARSVSGTLSPVQKVGTVAHTYYADMDVDSQGRATFAWEDWAVQRDGGLAEFSRVLGPNGDVGPVERVSKISGKGAAPQVEVTPSGRAVFEWAEYKSGTMTLVTRVRTAGGTLKPIQALTSFDSSQIWSSQLAVAPTGEAVYCWHAGGALHERMRAAGGALSPAETVGQTKFGYCQPGIDSQGNVAFAWSNPYISKDTVLARSGDNAGHLGPTHALSPAGHNANDPVLAMSPAGAAAVAWSEGGRGFAIQASFGP